METRPSNLSRVVQFISRMITRVAPPLHSIHWKVFILFMVVLIVPLAVIGYKIRDSIERSHLHSTEEGMIDTATIVAELCAQLETQFGDDPPRIAEELTRVYANLDETYQIKARLFGFTKNEVDTRILVFDRTGHAVFDTANLAKRGDDFSSWIDVRHALRGEYGSRWELDRARKRVNLYTTVPFFVRGKIAGAVSISKPTNRVRNFISRQLFDLAVPVAFSIALAVGVAFLLSAYITRSVSSLARKAEQIAAGEENVRLETWSKSELGELARTVEKMRRKLEGKAYVEEMATNLSHELKTPLAAIRGAAEVLEDGAIEDAARTKFLSNIQSEVLRLDRIVNELLNLARIESHSELQGEAWCDMSAVVSEIGDLYRVRSDNSGLRFICEIDEAPDRVKIPELQARQMLTNLLDNAIQFTPTGGTISLTLARSGDGAEIRVTDTGCGIEPELEPKIFDRFFTTKNPRTGNRGTGLGLAIVQSILRVHGGEIAVEGKENEGTTFVVTLPVAGSRSRS